ncbi:kinesin-like protein KIFC3 isoform X2 [Ruditapes philippinarum]|uniref:kinesin-like protein KIFC3 isoform X2 n=1 Tax=Ruditapes philippinarum TaxID=129788 RepID=UPI00295AC0BE|nr:kinesin-like protein KIFC3 isoform X2 [Ruditapes philippinarum]
MGDNSLVLTPNSCRYELRSRTPNTPNTPSTPKSRVLRSTNTPVTADNVQKEFSSPLKSSSTSRTPLQRTISTPSTPKTKDNLVFRTPMSFKPRIVGNKPVPSPSREEIWKQELGLEDDPTSDKENSSSEEEENQKCQTSVVEYRALQKVLAEKNAQRDETLLQIKNCKDKIRHYKSRLEREESNKRQQLKILRKTHEVQMHEKDQLVDNLQSIISEQEEKIKELEDNVVTTPRKRTRQTKQAAQATATSNSPVESTTKLIDDIKRLQTERSSLTAELNEVQLELTTFREESSREITALKDTIVQLEKGNNSSNNTDNKISSQRSHSFRNKQMILGCSTDTEKQVDVLQAENDQLLQELTEAKNAHTKAVTVSKLGNHRQQQLEEEIKRLKERNFQLEADVSARLGSADELTQLKQEVSTLGEENMKLEARVRELQAEIFTLHAKSPEVVKVTKVKQVESESLRKQYEACKAEIHQLKQDLEARKQEFHEAQTQVKYFERMLTMTQSDKDEAEASLWRELDSLNKEHQASVKQMKEQLATEKQNEIKMVENRLVYEHKKELHDLVESLNDKHKTATEQLEISQKSLVTKHVSELSKLEEEKSKLLSDLEEIKCQSQVELSKLSTKLETEKESIVKRQKVEIRQLEEDLNIAKSAALTQQREELQREKDMCLRELEEKLQSEHKEEVTKMQQAFAVQIEEAVQTERQTTAEKMLFLETKYSELIDQLRNIQPILSEFIESYILLQKEVTQFPKIIRKTVNSVKKEVAGAITGVSEYNKELVQKYQKEMRLRKKYHNELVELKGNIRVFCRVRPLIKEDGNGQQAENIVSLDNDDDGVLYINSKGRTQTFDVDKVFGEKSTQNQVFEEVKALVTSCIDGYNVCIFAYGQTGSGKTYTMEGTESNPGINQRALAELFEETAARVDWEFSITVSVIEIYNEMIRDLLGDDTSFKMEVKMNPDGGYHIPGLCYVTVQSVADVNECFRIGTQNRATAATNMNEHSSRSHALLCVTVIGFNKTTAAKTTGKLNLVDLAGSERVSKSKADGARLKEAQCINKSLSSLGDVIFALRSKQSYIPYRNSKLTYLLQDSLGGDSKTLMITQIAPVRKNEGETICSLNFAQRVRNVELGAATRKLENGDGTENDPSSPARTYSTPQRMNMVNKSSTPTSSLALKSSTPSNIANKASTPSSSSKLTPVRHARKK